jgi:hypothetical protein
MSIKIKWKTKKIVIKVLLNGKMRSKEPNRCYRRRREIENRGLSRKWRGITMKQEETKRIN